MLMTLRDAQDRITACCAWYPVDLQGRFDAKGCWVWIEQLELSPGVNSRQCIQRIIQQISELVPYALGAYWHRRDSTGQRIHQYRRDQLLREEVMA